MEAVGTTTGSATAVVQLTKPDNNAANDKDDAVVTLFVICGNPFGNSTTPDCPAGTAFTGPANKPIANIGVFGAQCCVSTDGIGT